MTFDWSALLGVAPAPPGLIPHFLTDVRIIDTNTGRAYPLNPNYFATQETAQWIAAKFGDGVVYEAPFEGEGGPMVATAKCRVTRLKNGRGVNCGLLAAYYERNPEQQFPGLAEKLIRADLEKG